MSDPMGMGFNMGGGSPPYQFITELRKQYDILNVPEGPVRKGAFDALIVVQPSTLEDDKLDDLLGAIRAGVPTLVFEDPLPILDGRITGTYDPRRNNQGGGPGQPPPPATPKGDIAKLWNLLGVHFNFDPAGRAKALKQGIGELTARLNGLHPAYKSMLNNLGFYAKRNDLEKKINALVAKTKGPQRLQDNDWKAVDDALDALRKTVDSLDYKHQLRTFVQTDLIEPFKNKIGMLEKRVLWDDYNPFPKIDKPSDGFPNEFVYVGGSEGLSFADHPSTTGLQHILITCPGSLHDANVKNLKFLPLLKTSGENSGFTNLNEFWQTSFLGQKEGFNPNRTTTLDRGNHVIAAKITGNVFNQDTNSTALIDVSLVADSDLLGDPFFNIRNRGADEFLPLDVDNVTLVLNMVDELTKDDRFIDIRARRIRHRTLSVFEESVAAARKEASQAAKNLKDEFDKALRFEQDKINDRLAQLQQRKENMDQRQFERMLSSSVSQLRQVLATKQMQQQQQLEIETKKAENEMQLSIREKQNSSKFWAVALPPILPLCIAIVVFFRKRTRELEGTEAARLLGN
jgi:hypothetical protein